MAGHTAKYKALEFILLFREFKQLLEISFTLARQANNFSLILLNPVLRKFQYCRNFKRIFRAVDVPVSFNFVHLVSARIFIPREFKYKVCYCGNDATI